MTLIISLMQILKSLVSSDLLDVVLSGACPRNRFHALIYHRQRRPVNGALSQQRSGRLFTHLLYDVNLLLFLTFWAIPIDSVRPLTAGKGHSVSEYSDQLLLELLHLLGLLDLLLLYRAVEGVPRSHSYALPHLWQCLIVFHGGATCNLTVKRCPRGL